MAELHWRFTERLGWCHHDLSDCYRNSQETFQNVLSFYLLLSSACNHEHKLIKDELGDLGAGRFFLNSIATFRNYETYADWGFEMFWWSERALACSQQFRNIVPIFVVVLKPFKTWELTFFCQHMINKFVFLCIPHMPIPGLFVDGHRNMWSQEITARSKHHSSS